MDLGPGRRLVDRWRAGTGAHSNQVAVPGLSPAARGIWLFEQVNPGTSVYNLCFAARHTGPLEHERVEAALATVLSRHPSLRSTFHPGVEGPTRTVHPQLPVGVQWTDLRDQPPGQRLASAQRQAGEFAATAFDLGTGPLVRLQASRIADDEHLLVFVAHHLVCDGGSLRIVLAELDTAYQGHELPDAATEVSFPAADPQALAYWRERLADLPELNLPIDHAPGPQPAFRAASIPMTVPDELVRAAQRLGAQEHTTVFTVILAAFQLLLGRHTGQTDFGVGSAHGGRARAGTHDAVGLLVNPLVLRADLSGEPSFRELVRRVRDTCLAAFSHRDAPLEDLIAALAPGLGFDRAPLFQAYLVFHGDRGEQRLAGAALEPVVVQRSAVRHDVELHLWRDRAGLWGTWDYNAEAFDPATVARMIERLRVLLTSAVTEPDAPASRLGLLPPEERALIAGWGAGPTPEGPAVGLHELVTEQVGRTPRAIAVSHGRHRLTYRQLEERSNQLAHHLRGRGIGPGEVVGIQTARNLDLPVAMLGVLKAGAAYLPLDPAYPAGRLEYLRADAAARVVLDGLDGLDEYPTSAVLDVPVRPDDLAYVLYTSGSTGHPKGVMITHRGAVEMLRWALREYTPGQLSRVLASTSVSFDVSVFELFAPLCAGGTMVLVDDALALLAPDPPDVTLVAMVPSAARELVAARALPRSVAVVNLGGEALAGSLVDDLYATGHVEAVYNLYGPTEDTTYSTTARVRPHEQPPPIGALLPHERGYVLDAALQPVPLGALGELYLAGRGLARGYRNRPGLTAERFVADPYADPPGERMYRTGDLVRYRPDGELVYLGRRDFQVKVRGHRIEIGEIEATLQRHPEVRDAAVTVHDDRLVGYVSRNGSADIDADAVLAFLRRTLPETMVPRALIVLEALPQTPNGKVDRRLLPVPVRTAVTGDQAPIGPAEELVAEAWREVLELDEVSRADNFFDLGGDSLLATRVLTRLRERTGADIPLRALFEQPSLTGLAATLPALRAVATAAGQPATAADPPVTDPRRPGPEGTRVADASAGQERLWFLALLDPAANRANVIQGGLRLTGPLRADLLSEALRTVVLRHEALRTTFRQVDDRLEQVIHVLPRVRLEQVELAGEEELGALAELAGADFDLGTDCLIRVHLARLDDERHVLLLTVHHIAFDGWSLAALGAELGQAYTALRDGRAPDLPPLPLQYAEFASRQNRSLRDGTLQGQLAHWRTALDGLVPLDLKTDRVRPPRPSYHGALVRRTVPADVVQALRALAGRESATPYMVFLSAFLVLLRKHNQQHDIAVGSPVAGRPDRELERLIGFFVNTVVVRSRVRDDDTFTDLVSHVRTAVLDALANQDVPFEAVLTDLRPARETSRAPIFDVMFNYLNQPALRLEIPGLATEEVETSWRTAKFDLEIYIEDGDDGGAELALCYSQDLFEPDTAAALLERYRDLLQQVSTHADLPIGKLVLQQDDPPVHDLVPTEGTVAERFRQRVARHPDRIAVWTPAQEFSYRELDHRARQLAGALQEHVPAPNGRIAILCDQGGRLAIAMLGVHAAGHTYVPLDTLAPRRRLKELLELAGVQAIVADPGYLAVATDIADGRPVLDVDATSPTPIPAWAPTDPDAPAYVIFTSGSTGDPKGVVQSHRNVSYHVDAYVQVLGIDENDRLSMICSATADGTGQDLFGALVSGALVCPADLRRDGVEAVRDHLHRAGVTVYHSTRTAFRHLALAPGTAPWPSTLHTVALGGEKLTGEEVTVAQRELPACRVVNVYGLTECSIAVMHVLEPGVAVRRSTAPIGRPVPGMRIELVDENGLPAELFGEVVCISPHLALGYLDDEQTRVAFSEVAGERRYRTGDLAWRLPDGTLELAGRRDGQVKLSGYRIETGEIEARLRSCPQVSDAAVVAVTGPDGETQLVAYVAGGAEPAQLRAQLYSILPHYMVPKVIVPMAQLPTTRTGKVVHDGLPDPDWTTIARSVPPHSGTETTIAEVIATVLGIPAVGRYDNFFDLGGQSLHAVRVVGRLRESLGVDVSLRSIFERPTVADLAEGLAAEAPAPIRKSPITIRARVPYGTTSA